MSEKKDNVHKGHRQSVKNQFYAGGMEPFPDHLILEMLLYFGIPYKDTNELAHNLINTFGSFSAVFRADIADLRAVKGMTENAACLIKMILPIYSRFAQSLAAKSRTFITAKDIVDYIKPKYEGTYNEKVFLLCFDNEGGLISTKHIATGDVSNAIIDLRSIAQIVLENKSRSVVLVHNHPYAVAMPSLEDIAVTQRLRDFLSYIKVTLDDHIIIADIGFCSMAGIWKHTGLKLGKSSEADYDEDD